MTVTPRKRKFNSDHPDIQQIVNEYGLKYHCNHCTKEITHLAFVKCLECKTETCVECFNCQHSYQVMHSLNFPLFEKTWAADEELLFVEGLELFGIGNWEQISEHIGTKNKQQVEEHYAFILESPDFPKFNTCSNFEKTAVRQAGFTVPELEKYPRVYFLIQAPPSAPANHEILGFMPGRREFDFEFENDAEQQIKEIEFLQDDSPEEIEFKCTMLNIYNHVLDQRMRRKKLIFDHDLTDFKKVMFFI
jgi:transcriptional adapter 2-alpha